MATAENVSSQISPRSSLRNVSNRERVVNLRLSISIAGVDLNGQTFSEQASTELITPDGATFSCSRPLVSEQEVAVRFATREALGRIVGRTGSSSGGHCYAIKLLHLDSRFWGVSFPPAVKSNRALLLECCHCGFKSNCAIGAIDSVVLASNRRIGLLCPSSSKIELWKRADLSAAEPIEAGSAETENSVKQDLTFNQKQNVAAADQEHPGESASLRNPERRKGKRIKVSGCHGCIELQQKREFVALLNVSTNGACFTAEGIFRIGGWIQIAAPYVEGGPNLFQPARIVRIAEFDGFHEYGIEFLHKT